MFGLFVFFSCFFFFSPASAAPQSQNTLIIEVVTKLTWPIRRVWFVARWQLIFFSHFFSRFLSFFQMEKKRLLPRFSAPCNLHPADWLLMAPFDTPALIIVFKSTQKDGDGAFSGLAANGLSRSDLWPRPFRQVTGRGLDLWQAVRRQGGEVGRLLSSGLLWVFLLIRALFYRDGSHSKTLLHIRFWHEALFDPINVSSTCARVGVWVLLVVTWGAPTCLPAILKPSSF